MVLLVIALVLAGKREKPIPVTTEKAARRTILQTVSATGKIQPETEVKISPEVAGEITELPVEDGMQVKKGDLLVKIKPDSYKALLEQQEAAISAATPKSHHHQKSIFLPITTAKSHPIITTTHYYKKIHTRVHCTKSNEHRRAQVRRAISFQKPRSIRRWTEQSPF